MIHARRSIKALLSRDHLGAIVVMLIIAAALWGFLAIADEVQEDDPISMDEYILLALRVPGDTSDPIGPFWIEEAARDITALGSTILLVGWVLVTSLFFLMSGKPRAAYILIFASVTGLLLSTVLKESFQRERPDLVAHQMEVMTMSFPSGHSLLSALVYLTSGTLLAHTQPKRSIKAFFIASAITVALLVGISRLYLGVHWPTDVLAGWCAGAAWALVCWMVARRYITRKEPLESGLESERAES